MAKKTFPLSKVYCLLEPGPVVMVATKECVLSIPPVELAKLVNVGNCRSPH